MTFLKEEWLRILVSAALIWLAIGAGYWLGGKTGHNSGYGNGLLDGWDMAVTQCRADFQKCETVQQKGLRE